MLFVKYVSDKFKADPDAIIKVPAGGSCADMVALRNNTNADQLAKANGLTDVIDMADFDDANKLGEDMVERLQTIVVPKNWTGSIT